MNILLIYMYLPGESFTALLQVMFSQYTSFSELSFYFDPILTQSFAWLISHSKLFQKFSGIYFCEMWADKFIFQ